MVRASHGQLKLMAKEAMAMKKPLEKNTKRRAMVRTSRGEEEAINKRSHGPDDATGKKKPRTEESRDRRSHGQEEAFFQ